MVKFLKTYYFPKKSYGNWKWSRGLNHSFSDKFLCVRTIFSRCYFAQFLEWFLGVYSFQEKQICLWLHLKIKRNWFNACCFRSFVWLAEVPSRKLLAVSRNPWTVTSLREKWKQPLAFLPLCFSNNCNIDQIFDLQDPFENAQRSISMPFEYKIEGMWSLESQHGIFMKFLDYLPSFVCFCLCLSASGEWDTNTEKTRWSEWMCEYMSE
jgi:hypothetical protein